MTFGMLNPEKIGREMLQICPPHLSDVATLPWEIQKSHFQQYCVLSVSTVIRKMFMSNFLRIKHAEND